MSAGIYGRVIGVDPGPTPGVVALRVVDGAITSAEVVQCSAGALWSVLSALDPERRALLAVERFVVRGRANAVQSLTRDQAANLEALYAGRAALRSASQVKPWATDRRLQAAVLPGDTSLFLLTAGMRHARDAARQALFCAVHDAGVPDPLSKGAAR